MLNPTSAECWLSALRTCLLMLCSETSYWTYVCIYILSLSARQCQFTKRSFPLTFLSLLLFIYMEAIDIIITRAAGWCIGCYASIYCRGIASFNLRVSTLPGSLFLGETACGCVSADRWSHSHSVRSWDVNLMSILGCHQLWSNRIHWVDDSLPPFSGSPSSHTLGRDMCWNFWDLFLLNVLYM